MKYAQIFALGIILTLAITTLTGCASIKEKLGELWQKNKPQIELPPVPTPEQPPAPATDDEVDFSKLKWTRGGSNFSGAKREQGAAIRNVRIRAGGTPTLFYTGEGFSHWPKREDGDNVTHIWCTFFDEDGDGVPALVARVAVLEDALVALLGNPAAGQVTGQVAGQVEKK